jgi:hypothetical protein
MGVEGDGCRISHASPASGGRILRPWMPASPLERPRKACCTERDLCHRASDLRGSRTRNGGGHVARRSHSTVISAHRRVENLLGQKTRIHTVGGDCELEDAVRRVENALRSA